MDRVLILHISQFGGHKKASENIEEALRYRAFSLEILNLNGFGYINPRVENLVNFFYTLIIKHCPQLWGEIYDRKKIVKYLSPLRKTLNKWSIPKFSKLINEFRPKVILATQAFPCGIAGDFKKFYRVNIPLIGVVTDYYPHRFWLHPEVDVYTVACEKAKSILVKEGVEENKIRVLGIPISLKFLNTHSKESVAEEFGFNANLEAVLIMGGGLGIGPIERITKILDSLEEKFQIIAVCGKNEKLYLWFQKNREFFKKPIFYFGYIDFVHKLMDFSDIIITKGGGLTVSEALAKGLATIVVRPIPGQEERNTDYLVKKRAITKASTVEGVASLVQQLLRDRAKLYELKEASRQNVIIDSSLRIANLVLKFL